MANAKKKCINCGKFERVETMIIARIGAICGDICRKDLALNHYEKIRNHLKKEQKAKDTQVKKAFNANDVPQQHKLTQTVFNKMRRLQELVLFKSLNQEPECISCGKTNMDFCCGHFKTVGSQGALRYDAKNTYLQCNRYCNKAKSGNIYGCKNTRGYIQGLKDRFGNDKAQEIIDYCETNTQVRKWTGEELIKKRADFNKEIKRLINELSKS